MELSKRAADIAGRMFPASQREEAARLLMHECGDNLPFLDGRSATELERVRFAVLKLCCGDSEQLPRAIRAAQQDWRDTLVAAGFGHSVTEHERWADAYLGVG